VLSGTRPPPASQTDTASFWISSLLEANLFSSPFHQGHTHTHTHTHTHPSLFLLPPPLFRAIVYHPCAHPSARSHTFLSVSAGSDTPEQASTGTHRWIVSQYLGLARPPCPPAANKKPDSSGSPPPTGIQVMFHRAKLPLEPPWTVRHPDEAGAAPR